MSTVPTGTVSFLFTDIEGSTRLWQLHPEAMKAALARHHMLLQQAIEANGGYVFQIIGDAFCAAFHTGSESVAAALAAQRALTAEQWGQAGPILVRLLRNEDGAVELRVADRGGGFSGDIDLAHPASLGLKVIVSTARQFGGTVSFVRLDPGTEFVVRFPPDFGASPEPAAAAPA